MGWAKEEEEGKRVFRASHWSESESLAAVEDVEMAADADEENWLGDGEGGGDEDEDEDGSGWQDWGMRRERKERRVRRVRRRDC